MAAAHMEGRKTLVFRASGRPAAGVTREPQGGWLDGFDGQRPVDFRACRHIGPGIAPAVRVGPGITLNCDPFAGDTKQHGH